MAKLSLEQNIAAAYRAWKKRVAGRRLKSACPDAQTLALFKDGLLPVKQSVYVTQHLLTCGRCMDNIIIDSTAPLAERELPQALVRAAEETVAEYQRPGLLDIVCTFRNGILEIIRTNADMLMPQPGLARGAEKKSEQASLVKFFGNVKVIVTIAREAEQGASISVMVADKKKDAPLERVRVTLSRDKKEIESYMAKRGLVAFRGLVAGAYVIDIIVARKKVCSIAVRLR